MKENKQTNDTPTNSSEKQSHHDCLDPIGLTSRIRTEGKLTMPIVSDILASGATIEQVRSGNETIYEISCGDTTHYISTVGEPQPLDQMINSTLTGILSNPDFSGASDREVLSSLAEQLSLNSIDPSYFKQVVEMFLEANPEASQLEEFEKYGKTLAELAKKVDMTTDPEAAKELREYLSSEQDTLQMTGRFQGNLQWEIQQAAELGVNMTFTQAFDKVAPEYGNYSLNRFALTYALNTANLNDPNQTIQLIEQLGQTNAAKHGLLHSGISQSLP